MQAVFPCVEAAFVLGVRVCCAVTASITFWQYDLYVISDTPQVMSSHLYICIHIYIHMFIHLRDMICNICMYI